MPAVPARVDLDYNVTLEARSRSRPAGKNDLDVLLPLLPQSVQCSYTVCT